MRPSIIPPEKKERETERETISISLKENIQAFSVFRFSPRAPQQFVTESAKKSQENCTLSIGRGRRAVGEGGGGGWRAEWSRA